MNNVRIIKCPLCDREMDLIETTIPRPENETYLQDFSRHSRVSLVEESGKVKMQCIRCEAILEFTNKNKYISLEISPEDKQVMNRTYIVGVSRSYEDQVESTRKYFEDKYIK